MSLVVKSVCVLIKGTGCRRSNDATEDCFPKGMRDSVADMISIVYSFPVTAAQTREVLAMEAN